MTTILLNLFLGLLGIWLYTLLKSLVYIKNGTFTLSYFILDNKLKWAWSSTVLFTVIIALHFEPGINNIIINALGLDMKGHSASYFTLGLGLANLVKDINKTKQTKTNKTDGLQ